MSYLGVVNATQGDTVERLFAEASPGWYLHIKSEISYVTRAKEYDAPYAILFTSPSESFNLLTSQWDEKSKPKFLRKETTPSDYLGNCLNDTLVFRVPDDNIEHSYVGRYGVIFGYLPAPTNYSHVDCDHILSWELLQNKCEDFVSCVSSKIAQKFPFDIFGNLPSSAITCPALTIALLSESRTFDLCWIYEGMRPLKYAVVISLIVKFFLHS